MAWSNHFLDALSPAAIALIEDDLERVQLKRDDLVSEVGREVTSVILPVDSIISVITVMTDGHDVESRTIGRESGFGLLHALGSRIGAERVIAQVAGSAWRIKIRALSEAARQSPELTETIVRHAQATIVQSAQAVACNALHSAPQRLCRWLLMTQDRLDSDILPMTQEHLATMLGVQRTTVTALASALQDRRIITYSRGRIRVRDRQALKAGACECYAAVRESSGEILREDARASQPQSPGL
jgi:CRP-like cAMP-binding protein